MSTRIVEPPAALPRAALLLGALLCAAPGTGATGTGGEGTVDAGTGDISRGAEVYGNYCQNCHGAGARGLAAFEGDLATFRERLAGTANMPDMSRVLQEQEVAEVFAYLRSTQGR